MEADDPIKKVSRLWTAQKAFGKWARRRVVSEVGLLSDKMVKMMNGSHVSWESKENRTEQVYEQIFAGQSVRSTGVSSRGVKLEEVNFLQSFW